MRTFVALLRGVNVGGAKRVPMADFRKLLAGLGYSEVATLLNSGNAVFRGEAGPTREHAARIAAAIARKLKVEVPVIVKTGRELATIVKQNPFSTPGDAHSRFPVAFTQARAELAGLRKLEALLQPGEQFAIGEHAAYLHCGQGILKSKAGEALAGKFRMATTRNLATTLKLHALAQERS